VTPADPPDRVSRALNQLPLLRAPETLLPRVMAAVQAWAGRPWYERAWFTWPIGWQFATFALLVLMVVLAWEWAPTSLTLTALSARLPAPRVPLSDDTTSWLSAVRLAASVLWHGLQPVLLYAFAIVVVMTSTCLAVAMALNRAVFGRAQHS
jgi:hypothetical protein